jgi:multiple sugar transport system substrate-binding protein
MKRITTVLVALTALTAAACTSSTDSGGASIAPAECSVQGLTVASGSSSAAPASGQQPVTMNLWSFYTGREFKQYCEVLQDFHQLYPWISIQHTGGKTDQDVLRAYGANTSPDLMISPGPDNVAKFCSSGAYTDLTANLQQDNIDLNAIVPEPASRYSSYQGDQCSLPVLSDAYGLYYNKDMFKAAGIDDPPKTLSELEADAKKLTQYNDDGSIKVAGWVPLGSFYENSNFLNGNYTGGVWYDDAGKSAFASDPSWAALLQWQKDFATNVYGPDGYNKLQQFFAQVGGPNSEWSTAHAFETEQVAMNFDGEWRNAFIADDGAKLDYGTAPFPVADAMPELYGAGQIGGDIVGIPSNAQHAAEAWLLLKYLALDTSAEVKLATTLKNVPTTFEALKDPTLGNDEHFKVFLDIFSNEQSGFRTLTPIGSTDADMWGTFIDRWESGQVPDLQAGLQDLANQIDQQQALG